jgi:hypothetical protein
MMESANSTLDHIFLEIGHTSLKKGTDISILFNRKKNTLNNAYAKIP